MYVNIYELCHLCNAFGSLFDPLPLAPWVQNLVGWVVGFHPVVRDPVDTLQ